MENKFYCNFKQCKFNINGICYAKEEVECPINNEQSVYEKLELLKPNYPHIKCLKRCDDNRCDCIKDFIDFLERNK